MIFAKKSLCHLQQQIRLQNTCLDAADTALLKFRMTLIHANIWRYECIAVLLYDT
jgi:hypothetical protein